MFRRLALLTAAAVGPLGCHRPPPELGTVRVVAAASLRPAVEELLAGFREAHPGLTVTATYGASGVLFAQVVNGGPADVFLSADVDYPRRLADHNAAASADVFRFASGKLVVWAPPAVADRLSADGPSALADPAVKRVVVAKPRVAPYGKAAEAVLPEAVRGKVAFAENVEQVAATLKAGAADVGFLPAGLAAALPGGRAWPVPADRYPPIEHAGAVLAAAVDRPAAVAFRDFLTGPGGRAVLARHGFGP